MAPPQPSQASSPFSTIRASLMSPPPRFSLTLTSLHLALCQVLYRVLAGMTPIRASLVDALHPNPDLYGPFWLCATLIFSIAVSGNIARVFRFSVTLSE